MGERYIYADDFLDLFYVASAGQDKMFVKVVEQVVEDTPTADVVEVETIKAWLYKVAINNVGYVIDGDFSDACKEIISRLGGLRSFAKEFTPKERGAK